MEPHEHVDWPPALKLFYNFLYEKKYLEDIDFIIDIIDNLEPRFIDVLRNRFGYTNHAAWCKALHELNQNSYTVLLSQWRKKHSRRNLWRDMKAIGLSV